MHRRAILLLAVSAVATRAAAQSWCPPAFARTTVESSGTRWSVSIGTGLFEFDRRGREFRDGFTVDDVPQLYNLDAWIGGRVDGTLRVVQHRNASPGPFGTPDELCSKRDRIFAISRADVDRFDATGEATADLLDWPVAFGAPTIDGNGDPSDYILGNGDRPGIVGSRSAWWVSHDILHNWPAEGITQETGFETSFLVSSLLDRPDQHAVSLRIRLGYHGNRPISDTWFGLFLDPNLGDGSNDRVGVDTASQLGYAYDDGPDPVNGPRSPAIGVVLVRGVIADADGLDNNHDGQSDEPGEQLGLSSFMTGHTGIQAHEGAAAYNDLQGLCTLAGRPWAPRAPIAGSSFFGCNAHGTGPETRFFFPGDPVTGSGWTETTPIASPPVDARFVVSTGPFSMEPGDEVTFDWILSWSRGADWKDSLERLRGMAQWYRLHPEVLEPAYSRLPAVPEPIRTPTASWVTSPWPNPASESARMEVTVERRVPIRVELFDMLGARRLSLVREVSDAGTHPVDIEVSSLPSGPYYWRVVAAGGVATGLLAVVH